MTTRKSYSPPAVVALEVVADGKVSMQESCKTSQSATGSGFSGCTLSDIDPTPCVNTVS
ncbi:MAG TPA: hypothetical protein VJ650_01340 [Gemmatimonadaceae bacterium]|nr:hypothetical protein [Gemmatimonadaceae bacterium]